MTSRERVYALKEEFKNKWQQLDIADIAHVIDEAVQEESEIWRRGILTTDLDPEAVRELGERILKQESTKQ